MWVTHSGPRAAREIPVPKGVRQTDPAQKNQVRKARIHPCGRKGKLKEAERAALSKAGKVIGGHLAVREVFLFGSPVQLVNDIGQLA